MELGFERITKRHYQQEMAFDRIEQEERSFHESVRHGYLELADYEPTRFRLVDASAVPSEVEQKVWDIIERVFEFPNS